MEKEIESICFPNISDNPLSYAIGKNADKINIITKNGEMAEITWFQVIKDGKVIAEIKESVCHIFYK
jgi:(p)ppGpp synthase/HD superfamily hydrolase